MQENLNTVHTAGNVFIAAENGRKIKRALTHIRTSSKTEYVTGDSVFVKREDHNDLHSPEIVIGQVNRQVFI